MPQVDIETLVAEADRLDRKCQRLELELEAANHRETNYIRQVARLKAIIEAKRQEEGTR